MERRQTGKFRGYDGVSALLPTTENTISETKQCKCEEDYFAGDNENMRILILFETVDALVKSVGSRAMPHGFESWVCYS